MFFYLKFYYLEVMCVFNKIGHRAWIPVKGISFPPWNVISQNMIFLVVQKKRRGMSRYCMCIILKPMKRLVFFKFLFLRISCEFVTFRFSKRQQFTVYRLYSLQALQSFIWMLACWKLTQNSRFNLSLSGLPIGGTRWQGPGEWI